MATGLALGILADLLFWDRFTGSLGVYGPAWTLFAATLFVALFAFGRHVTGRPAVGWTTGRAWPIGAGLLMVTVLALSLVPAIRSAPPIAVLCLLASGAFGLLAARYYHGPALSSEPAVSFVLGVVLTPVAMVVRAVSSLPSPRRLRGVAATARPGFGPVLRGSLLAVPFLVLFTGLLASADQVFAGYVEDVVSLDILDVLGEPIGHIVFVTVLGGLSIGWLHRALVPGDPKSDPLRMWFDWLGSPTVARRHDKVVSDHGVESDAGADIDAGAPKPHDAAAIAATDSDDPASNLDAPSSTPNDPTSTPDAAAKPGAPAEILVHGSRRYLSIGIGEGLTVLALIDALFAVFVGVQFAYLFGQVGELGEGLTYAEYARRGFFELVAVTILCGGTLMLMADLTRRADPRQRRWFNIAGTVLLVLLAVVLASAFHRMRLYELEFGYTRLRLLVYVFIGWLGVGLGAFGWALWTRPRRIVATALVLAAAFGLTVAAINPDAVIAQRNIDRYSAGEELDFVYLSQLSDDAVPVVVGAFDQLPVEAREFLSEDYRYRRERLSEDPSREPGLAFNLGSWRAWQALQDERFEPDRGQLSGAGRLPGPQ